MKRVFQTCFVIACVVVSSTAATAGPIINGGFEDPFCGAPTPCNPGGNWGLFESIPGWSSPVGLIEIGAGEIYGITGFEGKQVLELDSTGNATVAQVIAGPGTYMLSFLYADRAGSVAETFEVYWNSVLLAPLAPAANPPANAMVLFSTIVTALNGNNTLEFVSTGGSNSLGALIDDVQLNSVPDGGMTGLLLAMGGIGLGWVRRMVR
jgi:hypothetical protein